MRGDVRSVEKAREIFSNAQFIHMLLDGRFRTDLGTVAYATGRKLDAELVFVGKFRSGGCVTADVYRYIGKAAQAMTTANDLLSFRPTEEQISAAVTVFKCMAAIEVVRPIVEGYQRKVLNELGWGHLELKHKWKLPDEVWQNYLVRCNEERIAAKLNVDDPAHCPLLVIENKLTQAQDLLIVLMEPVSGISLDRVLGSRDSLKNYAELVNLNLRLLAPWCRGMV